MKISRTLINAFRTTLLTSCLFLTSCIFVPAIDSIKKAGITENDRKQLLAVEVKKFHDAINWSNPHEAMSYVDAQSLDTLGPRLRESAENEKIFETKVKNIVFEDDAYAASVEVSTRLYKVPVYVVHDRLENEKWRFSLSDGWKILEKTEIAAK